MKDRNPENVIVMVTTFSLLVFILLFVFCDGFFLVADTILTEDERLEFSNKRR